MSKLDLEHFDRPLVTLGSGEADSFWQLHRCLPAKALQPFILGPYYGWTEQIDGQMLRREVPRLMVPIIFNFGTPFDIATAPVNADRADWAAHESFVAGIHDRYVVTASRGLSQCLQVNVTLLGACRLGLDLGALARRIVPARDALGVDVETLIAQLRDTQNWQLRFAFLEQFILARFAREIEPPSVMTSALTILQKSHGLTRIDHLANRLDISQKKLINRFQAEIGLPPKAIAQLLRFNRSLNLLRGGTVPTLSHLAAECGYYDQAHFNRDFKIHCGFTPSELLARRDPTIESLPH